MLNLTINFIHFLIDDSIKCDQLVLKVMSETQSFECGCLVGYYLDRSTFQKCEGIQLQSCYKQ